MANTLIQIKRTSITGRTPNTTNLSVGELALNMADGILYTKRSYDGQIIEIGANNTNVNVTGDLTVNNIIFKTISSLNGFSANSTSAYYNNSELSSNAYNSATFASNSYLLANFTPSTGSGVYVSNDYVTATFGSNSYNQDTFTSNLYASSTYGSNNYNKTTYASNSYTSATFGSNNYNQVAFAPYTGSSVYSSNAYNQSTFSSNAYLIANFTPSTGSGVYVSNDYATSTFASNSYLLANFTPSTGSGVYVSNDYVTATFSSNTYIASIYGSNNYNQVAFAPYTGSSVYSSNAYNQATYSSNLYSSATYGSNSYITATFGSNAYNQIIFASNNYASATFASNNYVSSRYLPGGVSTTSDTQVLFNDGGYANGSYGLTYNKTSQTLSIGNNLYIGGNIYVTGNVTTFAANNLDIVDNMIYLNSNSEFSNPDIGFAANYNDGTYHHTGFFRDHATGVWKVFENYLPEPQASQYIDQSNITFRLANFQANAVFAGAIYANSNLGTDSQVLSSNSTGGIYWSSVTGYSGSQGPTGFTGSFGTTGYTGSLGGTGYTGSQGANSVYTSSNIAPTNPAVGDRWYNTDFAAELVYTYDGDSYQWVEISSTGPVGTIGPTGYTGSIGPAGPSTLGFNSRNTTYTASASDNGNLINTNSNVTVPSGIFTNGQNFTIFNNSGSNISVLPASGVTIYLAGTGTTGTRTLLPYGLTTIVCVGTNTFVISGTII